jgi:ABC-type taurine transport system substrate-binding protein
MTRNASQHLTLVAAALVLAASPAQAQDVAICFRTADRVAAGEAVDAATKKAGHEACQRALAETSSVVQKYHIQEADFDIVGRPPKASP